MTLPVACKPLALAAAVLLLSACEATTFEQPPLSEVLCDPALAGRWLSEGDTPEERGEIVLVVDAACQLQVQDRKDGQPRTGESTALHLGRHAGKRYAWVDGRWALARFDATFVPAEGDVYLVRYDVNGDALAMWSIDDKPLAHAIIDDEMDGEVVARENELFNRLTGRPEPALLERDGLFEGEPSHFVRDRGGAK